MWMYQQMSLSIVEFQNKIYQFSGAINMVKWFKLYKKILIKSKKSDLIKSLKIK